MFTFNLFREIHRRLEIERNRPAKPVPASRSSFPEHFSPSPNRQKGIITPKGVILHHTGGSMAGSEAWVMNPNAKVSYHVIIAEDGRRHSFARDNDRAWHAGKSVWQGRTDCNSWTLGVAFPGDTYKQQLTQAQIDSFIEWFEKRVNKYGWSAKNLLADHRMVSPGRKHDLNPSEFKRVSSSIDLIF